MDKVNILIEYFPAIILIIVIFLAIFVLASLFNLNFSKKKK